MRRLWALLGVTGLYSGEVVFVNYTLAYTVDVLILPWTETSPSCYQTDADLGVLSS